MLRTKLWLGAAIVAIVSVWLWRVVIVAPLAPRLALRGPFTLERVWMRPGGVGARDQANECVRLSVDASGRIASIERLTDDELARVDANEPKLFVTPGLIDLHFHLPAGSPLHLTEFYGLLALRFGVTTVRDAGDLDGTSVDAARRAQREGAHPMPGIFSCGPFVGGRPARFENVQLVVDEGDSERAVEYVASHGFNCVKSYDRLTQTQVHALQAAAREARLPVTGHVPGALTFEEASLPDTAHLMGVPLPSDRPEALVSNVWSRISAWGKVDERRIDEVVEHSIEHNLAHTPTLVHGHGLLEWLDYDRARQSHAAQLMPRIFRDIVWAPPPDGLPVYGVVTREELERYRDETIPKKCSLLRKLVERGGDVRVGTDAPQPFVTPGLSVQEEMRLLVECGVDLDYVWTAVTARAGQVINGDGLRDDFPGGEHLGELVVGAPANMLVFERDPLASIDSLDSLVGVVRSGNFFRVPDLDAAIARWHEYYSHWLVDALMSAFARFQLSRINA